MICQTEQPVWPPVEDVYSEEFNIPRREGMVYPIFLTEEQLVLLSVVVDSCAEEAWNYAHDTTSRFIQSRLLRQRQELFDIGDKVSDALSKAECD